MIVKSKTWSAAPFVPSSHRLSDLAAAARRCHPWLDAELDVVTSRVIVALGATAARAVLGKSLGIASNRGQPLQVGNRD